MFNLDKFLKMDAKTACDLVAYSDSFARAISSNEVRYKKVARLLGSTVFPYNTVMEIASKIRPDADYNAKNPSSNHMFYEGDSNRSFSTRAPLRNTVIILNESITYEKVFSDHYNFEYCYVKNCMNPTHVKLINIRKRNEKMAKRAAKKRAQEEIRKNPVSPDGTINLEAWKNLSADEMDNHKVAVNLSRMLCDSRKITYLTEAQARRRNNIVKKRNGGRSKLANKPGFAYKPAGKYAAYKCVLCGNWHLTSSYLTDTQLRARRSR